MSVVIAMVSVKNEGQITIGHVEIEVSNLRKSRKFYEVLLKSIGCRVIVDEEGELGFSNQNFAVWLNEQKESRVKYAAPTGEETVVSEHLAIFVPDKKMVVTVTRNMKQNGFDALFPPEEHPQFVPGYYAASFCDPDNHVIEVYTRPPRE